MFLCQRKLVTWNRAKKRWGFCINNEDLQYLKPITRSQSRNLAEKMKLRGLIFLLLMVGTFAMGPMDQLRQVVYSFLSVENKYWAREKSVISKSEKFFDFKFCCENGKFQCFWVNFSLSDQGGIYVDRDWLIDRGTRVREFNTLYVTR